MDGKGSTILQQHLFECAKGCSLHLLADTQGDSPFNQRLHEQGERRFAQLVVKGLVGNLMGINQLQGIEMMVQSSDTIDLVAAKCPQECSHQHGRRNGSFAQAKLAVTGNAVEFGRREKLLKIVVGIDNGHGFVRGGFVWR